MNLFEEHNYTAEPARAYSDEDLHDPQTRLKMSEQVKADIDRRALERHEKKYNTRIRTSKIGEECLAKTWMRFRWIRPNTIKEGKQQRIFERGHSEENRLLDMLEDAGWSIRTRDENGEQFQYRDFDGHLGGAVDGEGTHPIYTRRPVVIECKSYKDDRFRQLVKLLGPRGSDHEYYVQCMIYAMYRDAAGVLFIGINKDTEEIYTHFLVRNDDLAREYLRKADTVIHAQEVPKKIGGANFYLCKMCEFLGPCHKGEKVDINCRSCKNAVPAENESWFCQKWNATIPGEPEILAACDQHEPII